MKKNTKSILAIILAAVMFCTIFVACSKNNDEPVDNDVSVVDTSNTSETVSNTEDQSKAEAQTSTTENATETTTKQETTTKKAETTTQKKVETTTKKAVTTTKKAAQTTTKKAVTTTKKKETTTKKKVTTTKKATNNVSAKDVQAQVNAYIKSKGIKVDSSMTPDNSGWSEEISGLQSDLNDGYSLKSCKSRVDRELKIWNGNLHSMYCYYNSSRQLFYILYL